MIEIKGTVSSAICYTNVLDDAAAAQIRRMCDYELSAGSRIRIMPDVHAGKGCTIGTTMTIRDKVCPNIVGVDIGCGMYTVRLAEKEVDLQRLDEAAHFIPSGSDVWAFAKNNMDWEKLRCQRSLKNTGRLARSLGTLGGGNHFIELERSSDGTLYLVIHSGSRNLGKQVAEIYQQIAIDLHRGLEKRLQRREEIIRGYKAAGRSSEIQTALEELEKQYRTLRPEVPEDLCWLHGEALEDYLHDIEFCQNFARENREEMAGVLLERTGLTALDGFHTVHNYIDTGEMILRKGAIAAHRGESVLIPLNMRDGSILAVGRGDAEWNFSAPHGAGRIMSRTQARARLSMEEYRASMAGIYTSSVNESTLDEAPMAYKALEDIVAVIGDTVDIIDILKPVYNFKASEADYFAKGRKRPEPEGQESEYPESE
ncbi:MAG: RtcB family protein [Bacillota bacterium]|nr:RtcB family protein [Bacillota bacterium]